MKCEGFVGQCERQDAETIRLKSAYADDKRNWANLCFSCRKEADEYYEELWSQYYEGCL